MYKTILVPLDGSTRAEAILPHVEGVARCTGACVVLLKVIDTASSLSGLEGLPIDLSRDMVKQEADEAETYLRARQNKLQEHNIQARIRVSYGPVVQTIIDAAANESADLIAIASHGRSGLSRMFYGSVAAGVLQRIDRPLLLIRSHEDD